MALIIDALVEILNKPTIRDIVSELALFASPICIAVFVGLVVGWTWKPRWAPNLVAVKIGNSNNDNSLLRLDSLKTCASSGCEKQEKAATAAPVEMRVRVMESEELAVTTNDLDHLCHLVEVTDGGPAWHQMMDKSMDGFSYRAWKREPETGPPQYRSSTIFEDATPETVRDFFGDDEFRTTNRWDDMLLEHTMLEECAKTGTLVVRWVRKFPFFCSDREYIVGRRIWDADGTYYCVTKGVPRPSIPRQSKPRRVDLYYSSWCIRAVEPMRGDGQQAGCTSLPTGTVRSLIKSLGTLLILVDLGDWSALELPLQTLLTYAVDKRPKARKCAQSCVEKLFKTFDSPIDMKNASRAVFSMHMKYMPSLEQLDSTELSEPDRLKIQAEFEHPETLHMFNALTILVPEISEKTRMKILSGVYKIIVRGFSLPMRHILRLLEALVEHIKVGHLVSESENIFSALTSYVSTDNNPIDTVISATILLKNGLRKLRDVQPKLWIKFLPPIFASVAGCLSSGADTSKHAADILKELINTHINREHLTITTSQLCSYEKDTPEAMAITSVCTVVDQMIGACDIPAENLLAVVSVLFLALGESSYFFMKEIFLKLSLKTKDLKEDLSNMRHLESCIGTAVITMGPEKVFSLVPLSLDDVKGNCSNTWILPILKKYVIGAPLQYFIEHIVPLAESMQNACKKVKKPSKLKSLQMCFHDLWDLLPAFCRYPTDVSKSFGALSRLLIATLDESPCLHEIVANSVQELVNGNRGSMKTNQGAKPCVDLSYSFILNVCELRSLPFSYSEKTASRNIKALACGSMDLFQVLADIFLNSPTEKHTSMKEAIGCLASVLGSEYIKDFFVSSLEKCESRDAFIESRKEDEIQDDIKGDNERTSEQTGCKNKRRLMVVLASSFVEAADEELIDTIFSFIKSCLLDSDEVCYSEAYSTLSRILEVHSWFCQARLSELVDILFTVKIPVDSMTIKNRFSCLLHVLVYILKSNDADVNTKAFLILNEIIITLKTKKESRKLAYDVLLNISCTLKDTKSSDQESHQRLLNMVMGYLSSSSPHIMSGAISALSLLIHSDASLCIGVPNLIQSVLILLQNRTTEVIKAALGFIKVLTCSLHSSDLITLLPDILNGILPWSSVSKYHFRSKVGIILEILIRKCGLDDVVLVVPEKYKGFVRTIKEGRQWKKNSDGLSNSETAPGSADYLKKRAGQKRAFEDTAHKGTSSNTHKAKRWKQQKDVTSTNKFSGGGGRSRSSDAVSPSTVGSPFKLRPQGNSTKQKKNFDKKSNRVNKVMKMERGENNMNKNLRHASAASKPAETSKSRKVSRLSRNRRSGK